jgi:hypothetical protein
MFCLAGFAEYIIQVAQSIPVLPILWMQGELYSGEE